MSILQKELVKIKEINFLHLKILFFKVECSSYPKELSEKGDLKMVRVNRGSS